MKHDLPAPCVCKYWSLLEPGLGASQNGPNLIWTGDWLSCLRRKIYFSSSTIELGPDIASSFQFSPWSNCKWHENAHVLGSLRDVTTLPMMSQMAKSDSEKYGFPITSFDLVLGLFTFTWCVFLFGLRLCQCTRRISSVQGSQKRMLDTIVLDLQMVVSHSGH